MKDILHIEIKNPKAKELLSLLEEMGWIKVHIEGTNVPTLSTKPMFWGALTKKQGEDLQRHIQTLRDEWGG